MHYLSDNIVLRPLHSVKDVNLWIYSTSLNNFKTELIFFSFIGLSLLKSIFKTKNNCSLIDLLSLTYAATGNNVENSN